MSTTRIYPSTSILHELLTWSCDRPIWQRDALRRIITAGKLDATDIKDLVDLCRETHKANAPGVVTVKSECLAASHLPATSGHEQDVTLVSVGTLKGVNRLPEGQVLRFGGSPGLTVVYGDNGSGKSGYARVLKKACRSRGASPVIRPDAFAPPPEAPATGRIVFNVGGEEETALWTDGAIADSRLSYIFIFDGSAAGNYLEQDGPASFTPHGLDILPKLSKTCDAVRHSIKCDIDTINLEVTTVSRSWPSESNTLVGKMISALSAATADATVVALAGLEEGQTKRLRELGDMLRANAKQKAKETRASAERLTAFADLLKSANDSFSATEVVALKRCLCETKAATEAAKAFACGKFDSSHLKGTGEDFWRNLWEAARGFSESAAYEGKPFPVTGEEAKCLLCQQSLEAMAVERLRQFQAFYADKSQQLAKDAARKLKLAKDRVDGLAPIAIEHKKIEADLNCATAEQNTIVNAFVTASDEILKALKENLSKEIWADFTGLPPSPEGVLKTLASSLQTRAREEEGADDPAARKNLESERGELAAREWLGRAKTDVLAQIARFKKIAALDLCQKDTDTRTVTSKNTELTKRLVTDAFCERFGTELQDLGLKTLSVKLEEIKGVKGETNFGLRLQPDSKLSVRDVASEGEQRCIALAAFLAELSQAGHQSALVFDDPVSSLDHWHRELIAQRLVKESKARQVIVLTHDTVFLNDLCAKIEESSASGTYFHLAWNGREPGYWCSFGKRAIAREP